MQRKTRFHCGDFQSQFDHLIEPKKLRKIVEEFGPEKRRPPQLGLEKGVSGLVFHVGQATGTFARNVKQLTTQKISDSALSQRRENIPWKVFEQIMDCGLCAKADPKRHLGAFYHGLRLLGIDGSQFSVSNTPQNKKNVYQGRLATPESGVWESGRFGFD